MAIQDLDRKKIELTITMNLPFPDSSKGSLYVEQIQDDVTYKG
ncbi:MAG: hypothetical protein PF569_09955 [Candidatus Woesearchaeota archaeon]|nr:hypothetical protein [Candidatus Woesearchaeota archaeon]